MRITCAAAYCPAPIGWIGGKTRLAPTIIASMHSHKCYVEIFGGSMVVFYNKSPSRTEIVNDVDGDLVNLMKVLSGTCFDEKVRQEFIKYVRNMPAAREVFEDWKHWTEDELSKLTPAQRAFRFYYCVKKGFSSCPKGGYEASPLSTNRYNMTTDFDQFSHRFRISSAQIEHLDFLDLVEKYNRPNADVMFYADPPYFVADDTNYYKYVFDSKKHLQLKECCDKINRNGNYVLISYDDVPEVEELYKDYFIYRTDKIIYTAAHESGKREISKTEFIITNYDIAELFVKQCDIFDSSVVSDTRIDFEGHIGLTLINGD